MLKKYTSSVNESNVSWTSIPTYQSTTYYYAKKQKYINCVCVCPWTGNGKRGVLFPPIPIKLFQFQFPF